MPAELDLPQQSCTSSMRGTWVLLRMDDQDYSQEHSKSKDRRGGVRDAQITVAFSRLAKPSMVRPMSGVYMQGQPFACRQRLETDGGLLYDWKTR